MTKAEILKQIEELKKQIEALPEDEKKIRTLPVEDERFFCINENLFCDFDLNYPDSFDVNTNKENSSIGNYFKSKEDAEMVIRAMQIEQAIRLRRIELNDGWEPDWNDIYEGKYYVYISYNGYLDIDKIFLNKYFPAFGFYKSEEIAQQIIDEFKNELYWYFNEYYQKKDKMYVWGEAEE